VIKPPAAGRKPEAAFSPSPSGPKPPSLGQGAQPAPRPAGASGLDRLHGPASVGQWQPTPAESGRPQSGSTEPHQQAGRLRLQPGLAQAKRPKRWLSATCAIAGAAGFRPASHSSWSASRSAAMRSPAATGSAARRRTRAPGACPEGMRQAALSVSGEADAAPDPRPVAPCRSTRRPEGGIGPMPQRRSSANQQRPAAPDGLDSAPPQPASRARRPELGMNSANLEGPCAVNHRRKQRQKDSNHIE